MRRFLPLALALTVSQIALVAQAQDDAPPPPVNSPVDANGDPNVTVVQLPAAPSPVATPTPAPDVNAHLPASSRVTTDISRSTDGFDLRRSPGGSGTVKGSANGAFITGVSNVPNLHRVKRGDTLWRIAQRYTGNAYNWPRLWSYNPQIQNPHWLYPGDNLRLRAYGVRGGISPIRPRLKRGVMLHGVPGYVLDGKHKVWGKLVGAPDDQMLLSQHDLIYVQLDDDHHVKVGDYITLLESRKVKNLAGAPLVWIRGRARVNRYNPKTHTVRARITEAHSPIERGVLVGPDSNRSHVVKHKINERNLQAKIVGALYPHQFYADKQVVFLDIGLKGGARVGNRFFAVSRTDQWRDGLRSANAMASRRAVTEDDSLVRVEGSKGEGDRSLYPAETYAELMVIHARKHTSTCVVITSTREVPRGALVVARKGY